MSKSVRCTKCKKVFKAKDKRTKICSICKSKPKEKVRNCTTCKKPFESTDGRTKKCADCLHADFFKSTYFNRLLKAFTKNPYLEQFPDDTEGLINLFEHFNRLTLWRGFHTVYHDTVEETIEYYSDEIEFRAAPINDFEDDYYNDGLLSSEAVSKNRYKPQCHNNSENGHLHPADGNPSNKYLKGRLVVENLIVMPSVVNRSMGNRHSYLVEGCYYDTRKCRSYEKERDSKEHSFRKILTTFIQDTYDINKLKLYLKKFPPQRDYNPNTKYVDFSHSSTRYSMLKVIREELTRLLPSTTGTFKTLFSRLLTEVKIHEGRLEDEFYESLDEELQDFSFEVSEVEEVLDSAELLALPMFNEIKDKLMEKDNVYY